ncbi:MAG: carboxypeptidase regulatory-like domain-containing protein [Archangiaceae bacterium]|nr:carboxypeptidase regulatory-like domain-containing protein [Archangiaceae bacterium]
MVSLLAALAVAGCGPEGLGFDADEGTASSEDALCAAGATLEGLDVSVWQGTINWSAVKNAGKQFVVIRAAHGLSTDTRFATNWTQAKSVGIIRGAYQWLVPSQSVTQQANLMVSLMSTMTADDLPPVVDVEEAGTTTPAQLAALVQQWVDIVQAGTGRKPVIYSGSYFWDDHVKSASFNTLPLWIPNYGVTCPRLPSVWSNWAMHQYTSTGSVSGISGNVDLDRFNGTLPQLQAFIAGSPGQVPSTGFVTGAIYQGTDTTARLAGVTVTAGGSTQVTGVDGLYKLSLAPGSYTVTATKSGYQSASVTRVVSAGGTIWGSMGLSPTTAAPGTLSGLVYALDVEAPTDTSHPVSGATVTAGGQTATTTAAGTFSFTLPAGSYTVLVSKTGYAQASLQRAVTSGQTTQAQVGLTAVGAADRTPPDVAITFPAADASLELAQISLTGTASDDTGATPQVSVSVNGGAAIAAPVASGTFSLSLKLRAGPNTLRVTAIDAAGNHSEVTQQVTFRSGIFGAVVDAQSRLALSSASVTLLAADGSPVAQQNGVSQYAFDTAPGEYSLVARADGYRTLRVPLQISDEERTAHDFALERGTDSGEEFTGVRFTNVADGAMVTGPTLQVEGEGVGVSLAAARVNDVEATLDGADHFSVTVPLTPGANTLSLVAFGTDGLKYTATVQVNRADAPRSGCASTGAGASFGWAALIAVGALLGRRRAL